MIFLFVLNLSYTRPLWGNSIGHEKGIGMMKHEARELVAKYGSVTAIHCGDCLAVLEGFGFIGIEREAEYVEIAKARIENAKKKYPLGV